MPITKADVLAVLADPRLIVMNFSVGASIVSGEGYSTVEDFISNDEIKVVSGRQTTNALYDRGPNVLEVQDASSPLSVGERALILHECTHAISDIAGADPLVLVDEVAAFLAQCAYTMICLPAPFPRGEIPKGASPYLALMWEMFRAVEKYNLHNLKGFGAQIDPQDIDRLSRVVQRMPDYDEISVTLQSAHAGVPTVRWVRQIVIFTKYHK